ncbi:Carboxylesterase family-domain-containing protein [Lasiosphaeria miniovina]|uniref:Carboxylesterase family-domain-containing protein n=1 Tax=Lasiosphaeria miniovina TaxID=1954250 RepID=A0AA40EBR5_9PEZI|nr:Carboxylesterase family-domain-containing protein [Lasiosphaeria miniovina]KAK0734150.1 Carboxylesterase family-domain-containing protein [Lasiosphaeria miniovina]
MPPTGKARFLRPTAVTYSAGDDGPTSVLKHERLSAICPQAVPDWLCKKAATMYTGSGIPQVHQRNRLDCQYVMHQQMLDPRQTEDCLFLDVFVPRSVFEKEACNRTQAALAPVVVSLGATPFVFGSKNFINLNEVSPAILTSQSSHPDPCGTDFPISVSINYRLGMFGWLTDEAGSANAGLWDQRLAMDWVKAHIENFGGDPNRITLVGSGGGAASIMHHVTAFGGQTNPEPPPYNLQGTTPFTSAIAVGPNWDFLPFFKRSSDSDSDSKYERNRDATQKAILKIMKVIIGKGLYTIDELRDLDSSVLMKVNRNLVRAAPMDMLVFGPVVGGDFTPKHPGLLLRDGHFNDSLQLMVGHTIWDTLINAPFLNFGQRFGQHDELNKRLTSILNGYSNTTLDLVETEIYDDEAREELVDWFHPPPNFLGTQTPQEVVSGISMMEEILVGCNTRNLARGLPDSTYSFDAGYAPLQGMIGLFRDKQDTSEGSGSGAGGPFDFRQRFLQFISGTTPIIAADDIGTVPWPVYGDDGIVVEASMGDKWGAVVTDDVFDNGRCDWWTGEGYEILEEESKDAE